MGEKPTDFPNLSGGITGDELLFTQTLTGNGKFTVDELAAYINSGSTIPNYSTSPILTGRKWIDGKNIYEVVLELSLPSSTALSLPHGLSVDKIIHVDVYANSGGVYKKLKNDDGVTGADFTFDTISQTEFRNINTDLSSAPTNKFTTVTAIIEYTQP